MSKFKEIEMRLRIDENIVSKLKNIKMKSYEEIDEYFLTKELLDKRIFSRLRNKDGRIFFEMKAIIKGGKDADVSEADEIDTELNEEQYDKIKKIFNVIFPINVKIKKIRGKGVLNGCELSLDKVEGLGDFLEIEGPKEKIFEICKEFNINVEKQKDREEGYVIMAIKKMGLT